jgi:outer membrane protein
MGKRATALLIAALILPLGLGAQGVTKTKVGLCDVQRIQDTYYKESKAARELDDFKNQYNKEMADMSAKINDLESQRLDAERAGNKDQALKLEKQVTAQKSFQEQYKQVKNQKYKLLYDEAQNSTFLKELGDAIQKVAETEGFAMILSIKKAEPLFWIPEVDVTDKVIKALRDATASGR